MIKIKGFTLVEMVVCIVITGIVIFSIYSVVISANKSYMKLYEHSKNKNDVLYFNNLMRNSLESTNLTENFHVEIIDNKDRIQIGYYDNNFRVNNDEGCYRVDCYEFSESGILKKEEKGFFSTKLDGEELSNLKIAKTADLYLTVYKGIPKKEFISFDSVTNSTTTKTHVRVEIENEDTPLIEKELILKNVNKVYYYLKNAKKLGHKKFVESGLYMLIIHNNELNGENKEYYADYFTFKNSNFYTANFSTYTYVIQ